MTRPAPHLDAFQGQHVRSWYADSQGNAPAFPPLDAQHLHTDVCIIGGGLTGLSTALALAESGIRCVLLEGALIGYGASGRNGGQVLHGFACAQTTLQRQLGVQGARLCWDLSLQGVATLRQLIERYAIDCDLHWGYVTVAETARQWRALTAWQQTLQQLGYPQGTLLQGAALREEIQSPVYLGGLHDAGCGHLHPLRYSQGLARAATRLGAQLFEHTRVVRLDERADGVHIHTAGGGQISADRLVLACNVDIGALQAPLAKRFLPVVSHIIATAPLAPEVRASLLPRQAAICDSRHVLNYFRLSRDGRLLFGGRLKRPHGTQQAIRAERQAELARIFPALREVAIDYSWGGYIDMGLNKVPQFGRQSARILYAQGFAGHGVALTCLAGQLMARALEQDSSGFDLFARLRAPSIPLAGRLDQTLIRLGVAFYRWRDRLGC